MATELFPREDGRHGPSDRRLTAMRERVSTSLLVFSLVSLIFTGGYNWRRVDELAKTNEALAVQVQGMDEKYVKRDVLAEQFNTLNVQLAALKQQLDDVKQALRDRTR